MQLSYKISLPLCDQNPFCINADAGDVTIRQFAVFNKKPPFYLDEVMVAGILRAALGEFNSQWCFGEAWVNGAFDTFTHDQVAQIVSFVKGCDDLKFETNNYKKYKELWQ